MKIGWSNSEESARVGSLIETKVSFRPFIAFLERGISDPKSIKHGFYNYVLDHFKNFPGSENDLDAGDIDQYKPLLELIYNTLSPITADQETYLWAMSCPASKSIFYATEAFTSFLGTAKHVDNDTDKAHKDDANFLKQKYLNHIYRMILAKYYGMTAVYSDRIIYTNTDPLSGLKKYYRINPDTRFIDVVAKGELPPLDHKAVDSCVHSVSITEVLSHTLPLSDFYLEGFTVLQVEDVTYEYSLDVIKKILLEHVPNQPSLYDDVKGALKTLAGDKGVEFGLLPFLMVNNRIVLDDIECARSVLIKAVSKCGTDMTPVYDMAEGFMKNPGRRIFRVITDEMALDNPYLDALRNEGILSYAILPVYYNQHIVGIIEVYSRDHVLNYEDTFTRLRDAVPLVAQLLQNSIEQFEARLDSVIREKFTPLQSAVQWKFNEVALDFLRAQEEDEPAGIGLVKFENVYPLFGAIDIRNSTVERNRTLGADIRQLVSLLNKEEPLIGAAIPETEAVKLSGQFADWRDRIAVYGRVGDSGMLNALLQDDVVPYLDCLMNNFPDSTSEVQKLKDIVEKDTDEISGNRTGLERSIQLINSSINSYFDRQKDDLQEIYPCYFETFRTDGIEYDLYAGQSMNPDQPFTRKHLEAFRLWQLRSMCDVTRLASSLKSQMPRPLQTTQLIYVNPHAINISFRNDERHFDVDGSYNIRYQIVKKRIDKVHVKQTYERLTQPGKIAIVYFNDADAQEYEHYIEQCRLEGLIAGEVEMLELEELQGVDGLRAMRVTVNLNVDISTDEEITEHQPDESLT